MKTISCLIADDEPIARQILEKYIESVPYLELVASCKNAFEVMELLQTRSVDLLFLDINMPKLTGISLLKILDKKPEVIITTAYPEYAVEGFELSVVDYLLKPFSLERFIQAVLKVQKSSEAPTALVGLPIEPVANSIFVKSDKKIVKVLYEEITHVTAYGNYIKIFTDQMLVVPQTLSDFLEKLPSQFMRIHKSHVINFNQIKLIDGNQVVLQDGVKLAIGKSYRSEVIERVSG